MHRFLGARHLWLNHIFDLLLKLRHCLAAGLVKCRANLRVNLFLNCFGPAPHFFTVRAQYIFELRLESGERLLLHVFQLR